MKRQVLLAGAVILIVALAAWARFYDLPQYPPGLFPDEAANGEDVFLILEGDWRPFYPRGNGREALFFFLQAASTKLFGIGVWPMHAVPAVVGVLTVLATFFAGRVFFGRLAGLLAAMFLATSYWHVTLSRTGFRAIMAPLFIAAFTACVGYTIQAAKQKQLSRSYLFAALAGASFAGGFYTYIAYRAMVGVVLGILLLLLMAAMHPRIGFPHFRRYGRQLMIGVAAFGLVIAPLGLYFWQNPADFIGRAGQVSVFSADLQREVGGGTLAGTLMYTTRETLQSFFVGEGDTNWRHNVAGFPLLNPLVGFLFLLGLAWTINGFVTVLWRIIKGEEVHLGMVYPYVLLLLLGMLLPTITTAEGMPHGLRSLGLMFPIFFLAGTAGAVVLHWIQTKLPRRSWGAVALGVGIGLIAVASIYDLSLYFLIARNDAEAYRAYRGDLTEVAEYINVYAAEQPDQPRPYLVLDEFSVQTVHFLASVAAHEHTHSGQEHPDAAQHKYQLVDPRLSHLQEIGAAEIIIFTQSTLPDADRYQREHPDVELVESRTNRFGHEIMRIYRGSGDTPAAPAEGNLDA